MVESIKKVLMERDSLTEKQAEEQVNELREEFFVRISNGNMP